MTSGRSYHDETAAKIHEFLTALIVLPKKVKGIEA